MFLATHWRIHTNGFFWVGGGGAILWCSLSGDHPHEDLANFGYKWCMKVKKTNAYFCISGYPLAENVEIWWTSFELWQLKILKIASISVFFPFW
jgi:hypothetical protein